MSYEIAKQFTFAASHQLTTLPDDHKCSRLHGHNYRVELRVISEGLDAHGFVVDFGLLGAIRDEIMATHDHRHLNDLYELPTAEMLAWKLFVSASQQLSKLTPRSVSISAVRVWETDDCWAEYRMRDHHRHLPANEAHPQDKP